MLKKKKKYNTLNI